MIQHIFLDLDDTIFDFKKSGADCLEQNPA